MREWPWSWHDLPGFRWRSIRATVPSMSDQQYQEILAETPDGQSLFALINGDVGWLMYLRENGDAGFSSRNPDYAGPPNAQIEYYLNNGQCDLYPASWALSIGEVRRTRNNFCRADIPPPSCTCSHYPACG